MSLTKFRRSKGFTLIELMIVVAIIGILAAVAIPKFADLVTKSKEAIVKANLGAVRSALSIYYGDTEGVYPSNLYWGLTADSRYLPQGNMGSFTIPKVTAQGNPGHSYNTTNQADVQQGDGGGLIDNKALYFINSGTREGETYVGCTHNDTKGTIWTAY